MSKMSPAEQRIRAAETNQLLDAVANFGDEWVAAGTVAYHAGVSARGAGRRLTAAHQDGRCEMRFNGYMNEYRISTCCCGGEGSDGRGDVLRCPVHKPGA